MTRTFTVRWDKIVRWTTLIATPLLLGAMALLIRDIHSQTLPPYGGYFLFILVMSIMLWAVCNAPRKIELRDNAIVLRRLVGQETIPLTEITGTQPYRSTTATARLWGSGGFFGYTGWFANKELGTFFAYAGDMKEAFVVSTPRRTYLFSCADRDAFVAALREKLAQRGHTGTV